MTHTDFLRRHGETAAPCLLFVLTASFLLLASCGLMEEEGFLEVQSITPLPNAVGVDKAATVEVEFSNEVDVSVAGSIQVRYLDDTSSVPLLGDQGLTPPMVKFLSVGPFIWKPSSVVEVVIPQTIRDTQGRGLKEPYTMIFTTAADTQPLEVVDSYPRSGDTLSIGPLFQIFGSFTFNDYVPRPDSSLTISSPAEVVPFAYQPTDTRPSPSTSVGFLVTGLEPDRTYTLILSQGMKDYEGDGLSGDYEVTFSTRN